MGPITGHNDRRLATVNAPYIYTYAAELFVLILILIHCSNIEIEKERERERKVEGRPVILYISIPICTNPESLFLLDP